MTELATVVNPHGWHVYWLLGEDGYPIYAGRSANLYWRIGQHVQKYGAEIASVAFVRVGDEREAHEMEATLIDRWQPKYNKHGRPGFAPVRAPACSDLSRTRGRGRK